MLRKHPKMENSILFLRSFSGKLNFAFFLVAQLVLKKINAPFGKIRLKGGFGPALGSLSILPFFFQNHFAIVQVFMLPFLVIIAWLFVTEVLANCGEGG